MLQSSLHDANKVPLKPPRQHSLSLPHTTPHAHVTGATKPPAERGCLAKPVLLRAQSAKLLLTLPSQG